MRVRTIVLFSLLALSGCKKAEPAQNQPVIARFENARLGLETILKRQPTVLAFGEIHKQNPLNYLSTARRFANDIVPFLPRYGYKDIILEFIPDDPLIKKDLERFYGSGKITYDETPNLFQALMGYDQCGYIEILKAVRKADLTIHGGRLSLAELPPDTELSALNDQEYLHYIERVVKLTQEKVLALTAQGKKVAIYGGLQHNNLRPGTDIFSRTANYGEFFSGKYPGQYVEFDLLVPELTRDLETSLGSADLPANWRGLIPSSGITIQEAGAKTTLLYSPTLSYESDYQALFYCLSSPE